MRVLLAWYSRTGTTARAAGWAREMLANGGHEVAEARLRPRRELPYPLWLLWSFVPGSRVPLLGNLPDLALFDACLLAIPKWTVSCPPANAFLALAARRLPPTAVVVTCGGWDQDRYLRSWARALRRRGAAVLGGLALRRRDVESGRAEAPLETFLAQAFGAAGRVAQGPAQ